MASPFVQSIGNRAVGTVEEVYADRIVVLLNPEAPQTTALHTGMPMSFPRINGHVLIPHESGATICVISAIRIERVPFPKRKGTQQDFGLVDLPFPLRVMHLMPLGTLTGQTVCGNLAFSVRRGTDVFPSVGDPVLLPDTKQLEAIVQGERKESKRICIGVCPTAGQVPVYVDPDKLFGRHLAILGNTGAGKSCSVAGLVRWSLCAAQMARKETTPIQPDDITQSTNGEIPNIPNARFIVLDPNGEYSRAFDGLNVRSFQCDSESADALCVPAWLWNGAEWAAFTEAAPGAQRPLLFKALRHLRNMEGDSDSIEHRIVIRLQAYRNLFYDAYLNCNHLRFPQFKNLRIAFLNAHKEFNDFAGKSSCYSALMQDIAKKSMIAAEAGCDNGGYSQAIDTHFIQDVIESLDRAEDALALLDTGTVDEDTPVKFNTRNLPDYVKDLASLMPGRDLGSFVDTLNLRISSLFAHGQLASVLQPNSDSTDLKDWLADYIGADQASKGTITVIDLSLVPSEVIHIVVGVLARMIFEALQRYKRERGQALPTTLILDEAHTFVHYEMLRETAPPAGSICVKIFERIAREGRKFGLGLVLASQRPSEVSPTVLSQCNTFLLHRLVNDRDQEMVKRLVPDAFGSLLRELPSLPSRRAIVLGWAIPTPTLVDIREVPNKYQPDSLDPDFWDVWIGKAERSIDWSKIACSWQNIAPNNPNHGKEETVNSN